jgi:hypothetical protein
MLAKWFRDEIEACRPGSRDIDEPEMSQLADALSHDSRVRLQYETVQRLDARVKDAFADVPVPAGLADRLLAGLNQPSPKETASEVVPLSLSANRDRFISRRRMIVSVAAAILLSAGIWLLRSPSVPTGGEVTSEAAQWFTQLADLWQPIAQAPADLALPSAIAGDPRGWQSVAKTIARKGIVYRLTQGAEGRAVLYVLSAKRAGLSATLPLNPQSSTGGLSIGAWQSQGLVYVLVVEGDQRAYRRFLRPGRQPLA